MKKVFFLTIALFVVCLARGQTCYTLVWSDEFNGSGAADPNNWTCETGASGWGNNEVQNYTNITDNSRQEDGCLVIEAKKNNNQWTSARLVSAGKRTFTYGRIEFRAKLPQGSGTWPALWMLGSEIGTNPWPACGEIDIMEHVGKNPGQVHASLHTTSSSGATVNTAFTKIADLFSDFHLFRFDWSADSLKFFVDNNLFYSYAPTNKTAANWPFNKPFFLIMNIAMGGNWGSDPQYETNGLKNGIDPALTSVKMLVDYVRVYQASVKPDISGPKVLDAASTGTFSVPVTDGLQYQWEVPDGAQILTGTNSSEIQVKMGQCSGTVKLKLTTNCSTMDITPFAVKARLTPDTSYFRFPLTDTTLNNWGVVSSPGNFLTLSTDTSVTVNYKISQPLNNPKITDSLPVVYNFNRFKFLVASIKTEVNNPPSIVRIDLVDINGNVNLDKIFKITSFPKTGNFNVYASEIGDSVAFDLENIGSLNVYINYGIFGRADTGSLVIGDLFLAENFEVSAPQLENSSLTIYPNPVTRFFSVKGIHEQKIKAVKIYNSQGILVSRVTEIHFPMEFPQVLPGLYIVTIELNVNKHISFPILKY